ncbi:hypothetical protein C6V83_10675 [Gordonia iterans]|uniref:Condensation domain-containing protein n=2 Tax=Gordonia iterans TaxID=1004901 RepID=A0A2S0KG55_9ACTN|nr:hypothetical protein C6V83_10675 [Gordonia iterans]
MLDRMHAGTRIAVVTGPIDLPDPDTAGERLAAFARLGPATRIALLPEPDGRRWVHVPDAMPGAVADAPSDPRDLLRSACARTPFQVTLAGDYLLTEHDHGIGEIQLALYAMLVVTGALDSAPGLSRSLSRRDDGLVSAAVRVFGSDPRRVRAVLKILEQLPDPVDDGVPDVPATPAGSAGTRVEAVRLDAATVAGVRRWRDAAGVAASLKTLLLCGVVRALDDAGLALHPDIVVPVDCVVTFGPASIRSEISSPACGSDTVRATIPSGCNGHSPRRSSRAVRSPARCAAHPRWRCSGTAGRVTRRPPAALSRVCSSPGSTRWRRCARSGGGTPRRVRCTGGSIRSGRPT